MAELMLQQKITRMRQRRTAPLILELDLTEGLAEEPPTDPVSAFLTMRRPRLADVLDRFEPVGAGNPRPAFVSRGTIVRRAQRLDTGHVRFRLAQGEAVCRGIAFGPDFPIPEPDSRVDVLYEVERTTWRGEMRVELLIRDARPSV